MLKFQLFNSFLCCMDVSKCIFVSIVSNWMQLMVNAFLGSNTEVFYLERGGSNLLDYNVIMDNCSYKMIHCLLFQSWDATSISLTAGCDLFMRYVTRTSALEYEDFNSGKSRLIERAEKFGEISYKVLVWWRREYKFLTDAWHYLLWKY